MSLSANINVNIFNTKDEKYRFVATTPHLLRMTNIDKFKINCECNLLSIHSAIHPSISSTSCLRLIDDIIFHCTRLVGGDFYCFAFPFQLFCVVLFCYGYFSSNFSVVDRYRQRMTTIVGSSNRLYVVVSILNFLSIIVVMLATCCFYSPPSPR